MSQLSTAGIELRQSPRRLAELIELLSSMRFAISALTVIAIASTIGTVIQQNQPNINYINQFGPFWSEIFSKLTLFSVYNATWFLLILAFLLVSTTLCLVRNTPKMLRDMRSWRDKVRERSLQVFPHKVEAQAVASVEETAKRLTAFLQAGGYQSKIVPQGDAILVAAKRGGSNRLGYVFAHAAIVVICVGGLLDSDLPLRFQMAFMGKEPIRTAELLTTVPAAGKLTDSNPTYRASVSLPEGKASDVAIINWRNGMFVQELPFELTLKRFVIDYYSTGMPKLFASEVEVNDPATGKRFDATIKVNHPLHYKGVTIYQASFDDGGSKLKLIGHPMIGPSHKPLPLEGEVGNAIALTDGDKKLSLELTGFRPMNVEDMSRVDGKGEDPEAKFKESVASVLSSAMKTTKERDLRNVGPSFQYKLRDESGQAREFSNYMLPIEIDGIATFVAGMRTTADGDFRYLRIPADSDRSLREFMRLRAALNDPELRSEAALAFVAATGDRFADRPELKAKLKASAEKSLQTFANSGFEGLANTLEQSVAAEERDHAADVILRMLQGVYWELWQVARKKDGLEPVKATEETTRFAQLSMQSLSDALLYEAPMLFELDEFEEIKASVFQVAKAPGQLVVYLGCLFLVIGIFAMLYIRERRAWAWLKPDPMNPNATVLTLAATTTRATLDFDREFEALKSNLRSALSASNRP